MIKLKKLIQTITLVIAATILLAGLASAQTYVLKNNSTHIDVATATLTRDYSHSGFVVWSWEIQSILTGANINEPLHEFSIGITNGQGAKISNIDIYAPGYPAWYGEGHVSFTGTRVVWEFEDLFSVESANKPNTAICSFWTTDQFSTERDYVIRDGNVSGQNRGLTPAAVPESISAILLLTGLLPIGGLLKRRSFSIVTNNL